MTPEELEMRKITTLLSRNPKGLTIEEISNLLPTSRPSAAKYLNILVARGQAEMRQFGRAKVYSLCERVPVTRMLSLSSDFILVMDGNLFITQANDQLLSFFGVQREDLVGKSIEFCPLAASFTIEPSLLRDAIAGEERCAEIELLHDDKTFFFTMRIVPVIFESSEQGVAVVLQDITLQKQYQLELEVLVRERTKELQSTNQKLQAEIQGHRKAKKELAESESRYRSLIETINEGIWVIDPDGITSFVNPRMASMLGYTPEEMIGMHFFTFLDEEGIASHRDLFGKKGHFQGQHELNLLKKDGSSMIALLSISHLGQNGGSMHGLIAGVIDITSRIRAESLIRETHAKLSAIIEASPLAIIALDRNRRITMWNPGAALLFGWETEEVTGEIPPYIPGDLQEEFDLNVNRTVAGESISGYETCRRHRNGNLIEVEIFTAPLYGRDGALSGIFTIYHDITQKKQALSALRESERRFAALVSNLPGMAYRCRNDHDWTMEFVSDGAVPLTGYQPSELMENASVSYEQIIYPDDRGPVRERIGKSISRGEAFSVTHRIVTREGKVKWVDCRGLPIHDEAGVAVTLEGFVADITDRIMMEQALLETAKKLSLLSSVTRHDVLNSLSILQGNLTLLRQSIPEPGLVPLLEKIRSNAKTIEQHMKFTREFKEFGTNPPQWQKISDVLEKSVENLETGQVRIENELQGLEVYADPMIDKVILNLVDNAVRHGETVSRIRFSYRTYDESAVVICEDDGRGIATGQKDLIFQPSYGLNTGLGLFFAREILSITGIQIRETGGPGTGARFELTVPKGSFRIYSF